MSYEDAQIRRAYGSDRNDNNYGVVESQLGQETFGRAGRGEAMMRKTNEADAKIGVESEEKARAEMIEEEEYTENEGHNDQSEEDV